ncbi:MAG: tRNA pseudouridine(55) synthase TruB [Actinomycetota bacterium]
MSPAEPAVSGLLVVDKPSGCTSHDVVNRVRRVFGTKKVGHAGTLDPSATGVLLIGLGRATRLLAFLQNLAKEYRAVAQLGISTSSQDADGDVVAERPCRATAGQVEEAAGAFRGEIRQLPPMVSAVKVAGEPLYKAARRGEEVERAQRLVRVYAMQIEGFDAEAQLLTLYVKCSSGTYVRTLASDLGDALGCGAHLTSLRRLGIGSFREQDSVTLGALEEGGLEAASAGVLSLGVAMRDFPQRMIDEKELDDVAHGRSLAPAAEPPARPGELSVLSMRRPGDRPAHEGGMTTGIPVGIVAPDGRLVAVYRKGPHGLKPAAVLI